MPSVGIVGAGVAGLTAGCYLSDAGHDVTIYEKNDRPGGVLNQFSAAGYTFDTGPTWYLEPEIYEGFFDDMGRDRAEFYELTRLDPYLLVSFPRGSLTLDANNEALRGFLANDWPAFDSYLESARENYDIASEHFGFGGSDRLREYVNAGVLKVLPKAQMVRSLAGYTDRLFDREEAAQLAQIPVTFLGTDPNKAPAFYNLMAHVLYSKDVHYPEGGMYSIVEAMVTILESNGATIETNSAVTTVDKPDRFAVTTDAETATHDTVICAANYDYFNQNVLDPDLRNYTDGYWKSKTYSPSAFVMYVGVDARLDGLEHQNFIVPEDLDQHYDEVYETAELPTDPAYYVCAPTKTDPSVAPDGHEALFVFVPIAREIDMDEERSAAFGDRLLDHLADRIGQEIPVDYRRTLTTPGFQSTWNYQRGAALGLTHTLGQTGFMRPERASAAADGLYYTGSFTGPGVGVPVCIKSGELTARRLLA